MRLFAAIAVLAPLACLAGPARQAPSAGAAWRGVWITCPTATEGDRGERMYRLRREVEFVEAPKLARARVTADSRYQLFVNGERVARGPAACDPLRQAYDEIDLAGKLRAGKNCIAALVQYLSEPSSRWTPAREGAGGFLFEVDLGDGKFLASDAQWRAREAAEWHRLSSGEFNVTRSFEVYDARKAPLKWTEPGFDAADWREAVLLKNPSASYPALVPAGIAPLVEEPIQPDRLLATGVIAVAPDMPPGAYASIVGSVPETPESVRATRWRGGPFTLPGEGRAVSSAIFDFGEEVVGFPAFALRDAAPGAMVWLGWDERTTREEVKGEGARVDLVGSICSGGLVYLARGGLERFEGRERVGFRYLQVSVRSETPVHFAGIGAVRVRSAMPVTGSFECSDANLTRLWAIGRDTLRACALDVFADGPGREQRQYLGDARVQARIARVVFGDERLSARALRAFFGALGPDGLPPSVAPGDAMSVGPPIVDYALHGVLMLAERFDATGDAALVRELWPGVVRVLDAVESRARDDGLIGASPHWLFLDWAHLDKRDASAALNALDVLALREAARLADALGEDARAKEFRARAARIATLFEKFFDPSRLLYADALVKEERSPIVSAHANALAILAGIAPRDRWPAIVSALTNVDRLVPYRQGAVEPDPLFDPARSIAAASPFFQTFVGDAFVKAGAPDAALREIRRLWKPMLDANAPTLWEGWERGFNTSDCHAWSASPTEWLTQRVLGITSRAAGGEPVQIEVAPALFDLAWARGAAPTAAGVVRVDVRREGEEIVVKGAAPNGARTVVRVGARETVVNGGAFELRAAAK